MPTSNPKNILTQMSQLTNTTIHLIIQSNKRTKGLQKKKRLEMKKKKYRIATNQERLKQIKMKKNPSLCLLIWQTWIQSHRNHPNQNS